MFGLFVFFVRNSFLFFGLFFSFFFLVFPQLCGEPQAFLEQAEPVHDLFVSDGVVLEGVAQPSSHQVLDVFAEFCFEMVDGGAMLEKERVIFLNWKFKAITDSFLGKEVLGKPF